MPKESPFGKLEPNTPAKALLWINSIILIGSFFVRPVILSSFDLLFLSLIGIVFSIYLWYVEKVEFPWLDHYVGRMSPVNIVGNFYEKVKITLSIYGLIIIVFAVLRVMIIT